MSDNQFYVDALRIYLTGQEWRDTIRIFIASNCPFFSNIDELHPQQAIIWRSFQEVAENVIQSMLLDIGGSMDELEGAFIDILQAPSRGPRDEAIKDVLKQLESVDDFTLFAHGMNQACVELFEELGKDVNNNIYDVVMRMGFPMEQINSAIKVVGEDGTMEEVLLYLTSKSDEKVYESKEDSANMSPRLKDNGDKADDSYRDNGTSGPRYNNPIEKFIAEAASHNIELDSSELNALFIIAESVLEAQREALYSPDISTEPSEAMEELVKWASDMKYLAEDMDTAFQENISEGDMTFHDERGLLQFYLTLEERRQQLNTQNDASNAFFNMVSDTELRRMAVLDAIAATGNEDEQRLHRLLSRHEEVRKEIVHLYRKCAIFLHTHPEVKQDQVHHTYLLLKEQLTGGLSDQQLSFESEEDAFMALATSPEQQQVVNILLDIHIREDEQSMLKREIHLLLGIAYGDEPDEKRDDDKKGDIRSDEKRGAAKEEKSAGYNDASSMLGDDSFHAMMKIANETSAEDKEDGKVESGVMVTNASSPKRVFLGNNISLPRQEDELVDALKHRHRQALQKLKNMLENDKQRRLHHLEARLALLRERNRHDNLDSAEIRAADEERKALLNDCDTLRESMVAGFKQRCLAELRTVRDTINTTPIAEATALDDVQVQLDQILGKVSNSTSQEFGVSSLETQAKSVLLSQYEQETQSLLQRQQYQKQRQQEALKNRLAQRGANGESAVYGGNNESILEALRKSEESTMLAIAAAVHLPPSELIAIDSNTLSSLSSKKGHRSKNRVDDTGSKDDDYLDDDETAENDYEREKKHQQMLKWMEHMRSLQHRYQQAGEHVRATLMHNGDMDEGSLDENQLQALVDAEKVIVEAFSQHIQHDYTLHSTNYSHSHGVDEKKLQSDIKAHILDAFEAAKSDHERTMSYTKDKNQQRLKNRLAKKARVNVDESALEVAEVEAALSKAIDSFVADSPLPPISKPSSGAKDDDEDYSEIKSKQKDHLMKEKLRIRQDHDRNEQELVDTLQAAMEQKKRHLEERLRNKRYLQDRTAKQIEVVASGNDPNIPVEMGAEDSEQREVKAQLVAWDAAFHRVKSMVETTQSTISPDQMSELLDRVFKEMMNENNNNTKEKEVPLRAEDKKEILSPAKSFRPPKIATVPPSGLSSAADTPVVTLQSAADELFGDSENNSQSGSHRNSIVPGGSADHTPQSRDLWHSEAHRITTNYTQEQQRHDLMMKIQQARQRQSLQRKLWERSQQKQQQHGGTDNDGEESHDLIGARKPWLQDAVAAKQASQAVKGLMIPANLPARADPKAMSMRGMNLGPMMRK